MENGNFKPRKDIQEYLNNEFNIKVYKELTENEFWKGIFKPLDFLNLFYENIEVIKAEKEKPLDVVHYIFHFNRIELEENQLYYLVEKLIDYLKTSNFNKEKLTIKDKQLDYCLKFIENEFISLENKLFPEPEETIEIKTEEFDFKKLKAELEKLSDPKEKIKYLIEVKTNYLQEKSPLEFELGTTFDQKCDTEIKKLREFLALDSEFNPIINSPPSNIKISDKLSKADLIRLIIAMYELNYFLKVNGDKPNKKEVMEAFGSFLNENLSSYSSHLNQALNQPIEVNFQVFENMKNVMQRIHLDKEK